MEQFLWRTKLEYKNNTLTQVYFRRVLHLKTIRLRFLVSGHTFLPNDSDFGEVECKIKKQNIIFSSEDYIQIMKDCRKKRLIVVYRMKKEDFVSTKKLEKEIVNRKKTCSGEAINWLHIREIKLIKEERFSIFIKTVHKNDEYKEINIKKRGKSSEELFSKYLKTLWPNGKPVAEPKLKDIKSYLHLIRGRARVL